MGIKIDKISVKDLGPIKSFSVSFGMFNLIYSTNEKGKTFLTEFIIRSLFKNIKRWSYLRKGGRGKVTIGGLDKQAIDFSPSSKEKLEDYWESSGKGLPVSMAKLLVVKGGEAGIEDDKGISKFFIKEVLSGINILDKIDGDDNISRTVKSAKISGGQIIIPNQGEGRQYSDAGNELKSTNKQFEEIESGYARGILKTHRIEEKVLNDKLMYLDRAKRHRAYLISDRIKKLDTELDNISEDELNKAENDLSRYRDKKESCSALEEKRKTSAAESKDFKWLESALPYYKDLSLKIINKPGRSLLFLCGILAALGIAAAALFFISPEISNNLRTIFMIIICLFFLSSLAFSIVYIKKLFNFSRQAGQNKELDRIKKEFKNRTKQELTDIALFESILTSQRESHSKTSIIEEQIDIQKNELRELQVSISRKIAGFIQKEAEEKNLDTVLNDLKQKVRGIKDQKEKEKEELFKLGVSETDYLSEDIKIQYSRQEYENIQSELESIREEIKAQEDIIQKLKYRICQKTGDDPIIGWEELIENLRQKRRDSENKLREITAGIAAGISVHKVISELRQEEDTKIREGLRSEVVLDPLKDITRKYSRLTLDNDRLIVSSKYDDFDLKDLSTGAVEQVMLALRIGFTSKLLGKDALFLILDDAFQHSDWQKRKILIDKLADISKKGWQIIYLTMDDHIKELFDKAGSKLEPARYSSISL